MFHSHDKKTRINGSLTHFFFFGIWFVPYSMQCHYAILYTCITNTFLNFVPPSMYIKVCRCQKISSEHLTVSSFFYNIVSMNYVKILCLQRRGARRAIVSFEMKVNQHKSNNDISVKRLIGRCQSRNSCILRKLNVFDMLIIWHQKWCNLLGDGWFFFALSFSLSYAYILLVSWS